MIKEGIEMFGLLYDIIKRHRCKGTRFKAQGTSNIQGIGLKSQGRSKIGRQLKLESLSVLGSSLAFGSLHLVPFLCLVPCALDL